MIEDNELISKVRKGDLQAEETLLCKYKPLVSVIASKYFLVGADKEDLIQEGWIGLFKAINSYDERKNINFVKYASLLINREIVSTVRRANAGKNQALDTSVFVEDDDTLPSNVTPEDSVISLENIHEISDDIDSLLSERERKVVKYFVQGYTYMDIASILNVTPKSVDNTLTRIKSKLKHIKENL